MAGAWSPVCCRGCSSTSCVCDRKSKWSDSSLLGRRLSEDSRRHQLLQKWTSTWNSTSRDASEAGAEQAPREEEAAEDRPLVFLCSGCRRPLGDSLSWVASQEDTNCILLRCQLGPGRGGRGGGRLLPRCTTPRRPEGAEGTLARPGALKQESLRKREGEGLTSDRSFPGVPVPEGQGLNQHLRELFSESRN
jgi:hypothetical protein